MGHAQALGMAEAVQDGTIGLDAALQYHLQHNHYPPLPDCMVGLALKVLEGVREGASLRDDRVDLPEGVTHRRYGSAVPLGVIICALHLEPFVDALEEE